MESISKHLLDNSDVVLLQETWLMPHEISLPSTLHPGFKAYATSAVDVETAVLRERPYAQWDKMPNKRAARFFPTIVELMLMVCANVLKTKIFRNAYEKSL